MKKLFILVTCFGFASQAHAMLMTEKEPKHTHTVEIKFTVSVSPNDDAEWQKIKAELDPFLQKTRTEIQEEFNMPALLLEELKPVLTHIPEICKKNDIHGNIRVSCDIQTLERDPTK